MTNRRVAFTGRDDEAPIEDAAAEAVLVEPAAEDRLVDEAQLAKAETRRQELEADRRVVELAADPLDVATQLLARYGGVPMPNLELQPAQVSALIEYMKGSKPASATKAD